MIMPDAKFHVAAATVIRYYSANPNGPIQVGDCKPASVDTVEDNRTDFTLKVVYNNTLLGYVVFRMTAFAKVNTFDMLSNVKIHSRDYETILRQMPARDFDNGEALGQAIIRAINSLI